MANEKDSKDNEAGSGNSKNIKFSDGNKYARRNVLRTIGTSSTGLFLIGSTGIAAGDSTDYDGTYVGDPMQLSDRAKTDWSQCPSIGGQRVSNASTLIYWGSEQSTVTSEWYHYFTVTTHGRCEERGCTDSSWSPVKTLERIKLNWETAYSSGSNVTDPLEGDVGAHPAPSNGDDENYHDAIYTGLYELSQQVSDTFDYAFSAANVIDALINDRNPESGKEVIYQWPYNGSESESFSVFHFEVNSNHQQIDFDLESVVRENVYQQYAGTSWSVQRKGVEMDSKETNLDKNKTSIQKSREGKPTNTTKIQSTPEKKVRIDNIPEHLKRPRHRKTDSSYVIRKALPLQIEEYTWTGGPDQVKRK